MKNIKSFIQKLFPYLNLEAEYAWSGNFGVTEDYEPPIKFNGNNISVSGTGTQVACFMTAKQMVNKILK